MNKIYNHPSILVKEMEAENMICESSIEVKTSIIDGTGDFEKATKLNIVDMSSTEDVDW